MKDSGAKGSILRQTSIRRTMELGIRSMMANRRTKWPAEMWKYIVAVSLGIKPRGVRLVNYYKTIHQVSVIA